MFLISVFALNVLFISGFSSTESSGSDESEYTEFKKIFCDDENGTISNVMDECFEEMNLTRYEDIIKECYTGIDEACGKSIYDWYCANSEEAMDKADECAENKVKEQEGEIVIDLLKYEILNCTDSKLEEEEVEMEYYYSGDN
ncbi:uncharacterized protein LOC129963923 [Argiope bruennichi]|uniref:uncharacterized protein LOC129963923 n=1 Tax=Argiope bruennichi TaxID=94029 RepID=UPI0024947191|nr:uncharacterized protein LOC129963923 [Argiope bruennichi]